MKRPLLLHFFMIGISMAYAQLPIIQSTTIIPAAPSPSDNVKIVTKVSTPNQGIVVDAPVFNVSHSNKLIKLNNCYWQGMLTAVQVYVDTFNVGQLQAGTYTIQLKPYLSSTQQHCTKIDSNMVVSTITVAAPTGTFVGLESYDAKDFSFYPNPVKQELYLEGVSHFNEALIYQMEGWLVDVQSIAQGGRLYVGGLSPGLYFVKLSNGDKTKTVKFIKE